MEVISVDYLATTQLQQHGLHYKVVKLLQTWSSGMETQQPLRILYKKKSFKTIILTTKWYSVSNFSSRHTFRPGRYSWGIHQNERTPRGNLFKPLAIKVKSAHYSVRPASAGDVDFYWQMADVSAHLTASIQQYIAGTKGSISHLKKTNRLQGQYRYFWGKMNTFQWVWCFLSTHTHTHSVLGIRGCFFFNASQRKDFWCLYICVDM